MLPAEVVSAVGELTVLHGSWKLDPVDLLLFLSLFIHDLLARVVLGTVRFVGFLDLHAADVNYVSKRVHHWETQNLLWTACKMKLVLSEKLTILHQLTNLQVRLGLD